MGEELGDSWGLQKAGWVWCGLGQARTSLPLQEKLERDPGE